VSGAARDFSTCNHAAGRRGDRLRGGARDHRVVRRLIAALPAADQQRVVGALADLHLRRVSVVVRISIRAVRPA
jgi:hypothetical protein